MQAHTHTHTHTHSHTHTHMHFDPFFSIVPFTMKMLFPKALVYPTIERLEVPHGGRS